MRQRLQRTRLRRRRLRRSRTRKAQKGGATAAWPAGAAAFVINLNKRADRLQEFQAEMTNLGSPPVERFAAVERSPGILGCGLSHLAVLKEAKRRQLPAVCIFEDDFEVTVPATEFWKRLRSFFEGARPWDVLMLAHNTTKSEPAGDALVKIIESQTASAYFVNAPFYDKLIGLYEEAMPQLEQTGQHWVYANDQCWKRLQPTANWFAFKPPLGKQRRSHSNTSGKLADYGV